MKTKALLISIATSIALAVIVVVKCKQPGGHSNLATGLMLSQSSSAVSSTPVSIPMVAVPGGTFQRDSTATDRSTVSSFQMSKSEITRGQFSAVVGIDPSDTSYSNSPGTDDPVQNVTWYHALVFCNKLSISAGLVPVYSIMVSGVPRTDPADWGPIPTGDDAAWNNVAWNNAANGYRLPTRMEWIWAAMGATSDARAADIVGGINTGGYTKGYAGSAEATSGIASLANYAWFSTNTPGFKSHPVGGLVSDRQPNELGLYDMSGNVWEWCWESDAYFPAGPLTDYRGNASTGYHVYAGGSWADNGSSMAISGYGAPYETVFYKRYNIGFRVARK